MILKIFLSIFYVLINSHKHANYADKIIYIIDPEQICCRHIPILEFVSGCHGNHTFSHSPNNFVSHFWVPIEQFVILENLSKGRGCIVN